MFALAQLLQAILYASGELVETLLQLFEHLARIVIGSSSNCLGIALGLGDEALAFCFDCCE